MPQRRSAPAVPLLAMLALAAILALAARAADPPHPAGPPAGGGPRDMGPPMPPDTALAVRDSLMNAVLRSIAGRENAPAESVFKNIRTLKGMPAGRMLRVMNVAFGRSLGVGCAHCHDVEHWDNDDKRPKLAARDMWTMTQTLNTELIGRMTHLESRQPGVNCTTCHRGTAQPGTGPMMRR